MKVYLDMDGVLSDFMASYQPLGVKFYPAVTEHRIFENLAMLPNAKKLIALLVHDLQCEVEILSSLGTHNEDVSAQAKEQKEKWLNKHSILFERNFVHSWAYKHTFAEPTAVMIDDRKDVIESFVEHGGLGVHYDDANWDAMEHKIRQAVTRARQLERVDKEDSMNPLRVVYHHIGVPTVAIEPTASGYAVINYITGDNDNFLSERAAEDWAQNAINDLDEMEFN